MEEDVKISGREDRKEKIKGYGSNRNVERGKLLSGSRNCRRIRTGMRVRE